MPEILDLINENDEVIGTAMRKDVIEKKLLHRGASIEIISAGGQVVGDRL